MVRGECDRAHRLTALAHRPGGVNWRGSCERLDFARLGIDDPVTRGAQEGLMPTMVPRFVMLAFAGLVLSVMLRGTPSGAAQAPAQPSLQGQLLIATEVIGDPRFDHAVILIVRHDRDGALGVVINHPLGERPLADVLARSAPRMPRRRAVSAFFSAARCNRKSVL